MSKKKIPKLRFSEFDQEWEEKTLGELSSGSSYGMNSAATSYDGTNKYLRITDISNTTNDFLLNDLVSPSNKLDEKYLLKEGDILFARTGASVGKSYYYKKEDGIVYFAGFLIRFQIKDKFSHKFIFYNTLTNTYDNWVTATSMRSGQPGINETEYSDFKLFLPSKKEQEKIGKFFELLDQNLKAKEKEIKKMNELKKAYMQQIFNQELRFTDSNGDFFPEWRKKKLSEITDVVSSGLSIQNLKENGKTPVYDVSGIVGYTNQKGINKNYVTIIKDGSGVGRVRILPAESYFIGTMNGIYSTSENIYFIYLILKNINYKKYIVGSGIPHIYYKDYSEEIIKIPCLQEQKKIADFLSTMDRKIELKNQELEKIKKYKKAFLEKMFV